MIGTLIVEIHIAPFMLIFKRQKCYNVIQCVPNTHTHIINLTNR